MSISKRFLTFIFTAPLALSFFAATELVAQQYSGLKMPPGYIVGPELPDTATKQQQTEWSRKYGPAKRRLNDGTKKVKEVLATGGDVKSNPEARQFLEKVVFPAMTQTDLTLSNLGAKRKQFLKDFLGKAVSQPARGSMIDFTIETLRAYSTNAALHPSARLNAVILISQLTDVPLNRGQAPRASRQAFDALQQIFNGENEKEFPEYLKIAAFSGMKNQLEMNSKSGQSIDANVKGPLVEAVMKFLPEAADPEKDALGYWRKRLAVQFAAVLKAPQTMTPLLAILKDDAASFQLKLEVVKTISETGSMANNPKTNGTVVAAVCGFAAKAVGDEATTITATREKMIRDGVLYGDFDLNQKTPIDFEPTLEDGSVRRGGDGSDTRAAIIELPNYQLNIFRDRLRAVAIFCPQAITAASQQGGLDTKAQTLANGTNQALNALLKQANVGLVDVEVRVRGIEPTPQEKDQARKTSYVDQMVKVCEDSAKTLNEQRASYDAE